MKKLTCVLLLLSLASAACQTGPHRKIYPGIAGSGYYIADTANQVIRKVSSLGIISALAITSADPDWNPANFSPVAMVSDASNNLIVLDALGRFVWQINKTSLVATRLAGSGATSGGVPGPALSAGFNNLNWIDIDTAGNLYFSSSSEVIYAVNRQGTTQTLLNVSIPSGNIAIVAGQLGSAGFSGDGGQATSAKLQQPQGVALDGSGNLYFSDSQNSRVREVTTAGVINTVVGNGHPNYSGDGGAASAALIHSPMDIKCDRAGTGLLYLADYFNARIRAINFTGSSKTVFGVTIANGNIATVAGGGNTTSGADNQDVGPGIAPIGTAAVGLTGRQSGVVDTSGTTVTWVSGNQFTGFGYLPGNPIVISGVQYSVQSINSATQLTLDPASGTPPPQGGVTYAMVAESTIPWADSSTINPATGELYIGFDNTLIYSGFINISSNIVRKVTTSGILYTPAGFYPGTPGNSGNGGPATSALLNEPLQIAF